jgi:hypothetical protein
MTEAVGRTQDREISDPCFGLACELRTIMVGSTKTPGWSTAITLCTL